MSELDDFFSVRARSQTDPFLLHLIDSGEVQPLEVREFKRAAYQYLGLEPGGRFARYRRGRDRRTGSDEPS